MIKFPPKTILVAYDFTDASRTAWRHASELAARCGAALEAVHVVPRLMSVELPAPVVPTPEDIRGLRAKVRKAVGSAASKITILYGDPAASILDLTRRRHPDILVVGTHGRRGLERLALGSVAEVVVRRARVPVLVARGRFRPIRRILAPVNFTSYSEYGLDCAAATAAVLSARLTALHVAEDSSWSESSRYRLGGLLNRLPREVRERCRPESVEAVGDPVKAILKARRMHDWIVLVEHEKSLVKDAFFGTTLERVLRSSSIPVLSVPVPARQPFALRVTGRALTLK